MSDPQPIQAVAGAKPEARLTAGKEAPFIWQAVAAIQKILASPDPKNGARKSDTFLVYCALAFIKNDKENVGKTSFQVSKGYIRQRCGGDIGITAIKNSLYELESLGLLHIERRKLAGKTANEINVYTLLTSVTRKPRVGCQKTEAQPPKNRGSVEKRAPISNRFPKKKKKKAAPAALSFSSLKERSIASPQNRSASPAASGAPGVAEAAARERTEGTDGTGGRPEKGEESDIFVQYYLAGKVKGLGLNDDLIKGTLLDDGIRSGTVRVAIPDFDPEVWSGVADAFLEPAMKERRGKPCKVEIVPTP